MQLTVEHLDGRVPITVMALDGALDASNYDTVIAKAQELYTRGTRHVLLDLSRLSFMGSSGLVALHSIALLLRGEQPPDPEYGWQAFHDIERDQGAVDPHLKLLNPQPKVRRTLDMTGMLEMFEVFEERDAAIASF